jgi:branched-subunit amino acid aminotransferase/4-amino-4-deoxychorismate lyase
MPMESRCAALLMLMMKKPRPPLANAAPSSRSGGLCEAFTATSSIQSQWPALQWDGKQPRPRTECKNGGGHGRAGFGSGRHHKRIVAEALASRLRATVYVTEGHWGENTKSDLVLTAFHCDKGPHKPMDTGVSTWQRAADLALPYRIKTSSNYQVARLAKIEGRERGYAEMILLNQHGRLAESVGSAVLVVRDGVILTPPPWEGAIESITVDILEALAADLKIPFKRRPIDRTELIIADEMAFVSTLNDVTTVASLDGTEFSDPCILNALSRRYFAAADGTDPHPAVKVSRRHCCGMPRGRA